MRHSLTRPRTEPETDVLTLDGAASLLRLSDRTTRELAVAGELPATRLGRQWRFSRRALLAHVERPAATPTAETTSDRCYYGPRDCWATVAVDAAGRVTCADFAPTLADAKAGFRRRPVPANATQPVRWGFVYLDAEGLYDPSVTVWHDDARQ